MSDTILQVRSTKQFIFDPSKLIIRVIGSDLNNRTATIYYELIDESLAATGRTSLEWADKGNMVIPIDIIAGAFNPDGTPNKTIITAVLSQFNLELKEDEA